MGSKLVESKSGIRIFNKEGNTTVYTSKNYKNVKSVALKLSNMLEVELVDNILY